MAQQMAYATRVSGLALVTRPVVPAAVAQFRRTVRYPRRVGRLTM